MRVVFVIEGYKKISEHVQKGTKLVTDIHTVPLGKSALNQIYTAK